MGCPEHHHEVMRDVLLLQQWCEHTRQDPLLFFVLLTFRPATYGILEHGQHLVLALSPPTVKKSANKIHLAAIYSRDCQFQ